MADVLRPKRPLLDRPEEIVLQILAHLFEGQCVIHRSCADSAVSRHPVNILQTCQRLHALGKMIMQTSFARYRLRLESIIPDPKDFKPIFVNNKMERLVDFLPQYGDCFDKVVIVDASCPVSFKERFEWFPNLDRLEFRDKRFKSEYVLPSDENLRKNDIFSEERVGVICKSWCKGLFSSLTADFVEQFKMQKGVDRQYSISVQIQMKILPKQYWDSGYGWDDEESGQWMVHMTDGRFVRCLRISDTDR